MYSGHVYTKDGLPLAGLKVSDGRNICITDRDGFYSLPGWERANLISVQILTRHHDDWYRYIDKDHKTYDFYITPYEKSDTCSFFHFSDTEIFIDGANAESWVDGIKDLSNTYKPDFILHTGDICRRRGLEYHRYALNSDNAGCPVRYTLGNHDYVNDKYGEYTFERLYGPIWYSFDLGKIHFIVLPIPYGEAPSNYAADDRLLWLKNDLAVMEDGLRPVILCHEPCKTFHDGCILKGDTVTVNLADHNTLAWVFGHLHIHLIEEFNGILHIGTGRPDFGGIDGTPAGCRYTIIDKDQKLVSSLIYNKKCSNLCETQRYVLGKNSCFTSPLYADGDFFASMIDDGYPSEAAIIRFNSKGEVIWKHPISASVKWNIEYYNDYIYSKDNLGILRCMAARDGSLIWSKELPRGGCAFANGGLRISKGKIYTMTNSRAYVIDAENGNILLESEYNELDSGMCVTSPVVLGDNIIFGKHWRGLFCFDGKNGKTLWHNKEIIDSIADPIIEGEFIYAPTRFFVAKLDKNGVILEKSEERTEFFFNSPSTPLYHKGMLFVPTTERGLGVYNADTLKLIKYIEPQPSLIAASPYVPIGRRGVLGKPIVDGDELIFTALDGKVYFCSIESLEIKRTISIGHPIVSGIVCGDDKYCIADFDGGISFITK